MMKVLVWVVVVPVGLFLAWALMRTPSPDENERWRQAKAIELCWEGQGKRSLDPATARFAAGACEQMEEKFVQRWGRKP